VTVAKQRNVRRPEDNNMSVVKQRSVLDSEGGQTLIRLRCFNLSLLTLGVLGRELVHEIEVVAWMLVMVGGSLW
jgi:hypothetical protein